MSREVRIPGIRRLFRALAAWRTVERDVDEEIRFHLESRAAELEARGMPPDAARDEAAREFGDVVASRRELAAVDRRRLGRARQSDWWEALGQDLRFAGRALLRRPAFTAMVVATLALAIGANGVMFGIIDRLLLRGPAHVREPERLRRVFAIVSPPGMEAVKQSALGYVTYTYLKGVSGLEGDGAYAYGEETFGQGAEARLLYAGYATWDLFPLLGVTPVLGRFFGEEEDRPAGAARVVILGYGFWRQRFAGARDVVGRALTLTGQDYIVVGVAPQGFTGAELKPVDVWLPMSVMGPRIRTDWSTSRHSSWLSIIVRLAPGVTHARAAAAATLVHLNASEGEQNAVARGRLELLPIGRNPQGGAEAPEMAVSRWLTGVATVVLLIACANVANLLLARATRRRREIAVRLALGVSRVRLIRLLLAESLLLALCGGAAGLAVAYWTGPLVRRLLLPGVAWAPSAVDARVLGFTALATIVTGVLVGLVPALQASRPDLTVALKTGAREGGGRRNRLRTTLLVVQPALSLILLLGAGLFVESLHKVRTLDLGIDADRVLAARVRWPSTAGLSPEALAAENARRRAFLDAALARVSSLPWVEHASFSIGTPFTTGFGVNLRVPGVDSIPALPGGGPYVSVVSSDHFATAGLRLLDGRGFTSADGAGTERVAVVNATMARELWHGQEPLGRCLQVFNDTLPCARVVGVVENTHYWRLKELPSMQFYVPLGQEVGLFGRMLLVRPRGDPEQAIEPLRRELQALLPDLPYTKITRLGDALESQVRPWKLGATMFSLFGALALVVAAFGLFSVIAYVVEQRTHEFGVRIALGASAGDILRHTLRHALAPAGLGLALGLAAALAAGRYFEPLLFDTSARDPRVFALAVTVLAAVSVAAALVPGWRATRVDPTTALRAE